MELDIYSILGKKEKKATLPFAVDESVDVEHLYYLVDKYQKAYVREGNSSTKTRSDVRGGGAKPYKQKGTGRARRGTNRTPLRPGGGVVFGPKPRSFKMNINNKIFKIVFQNAFNARLEDTVILKSQEKELKTKDFSGFLSSLKKDAKKVLVISTDDDVNVNLACRNISGLTVCDATFIPLQELLSGNQIVITENALPKIEEIYKK